MAENLQSRKRRHEEQRDWSALPSDVLGRVFSFLGREDQTKMSLVCKRWTDGFETPEVWKVFLVSHSDFYVGSPVMKFAKRFSNKFKHVEIHCDFFLDPHFSWCNPLKTFLETLTTESILHAFKFEWNFSDEEQYNSERYRDLYELFAKLLLSQRHLKRLELHGFRLKYRNGVDLITKAIESSRDSLKHLVFSEFVSNQSIFEEQDLANPFQVPSSLSVFKIDYGLLFGIQDASESHANKILQNCNSELILDVFVEVSSLCFEGFQIMSPSGWRNLKRRFPGLKLELYAGLTVNHQQYPPAFFIVEDMPITCLAYHFRENPPPLADFLQLLRSCKITDHLMYLHLKWPVELADIENIFNQFFNECRKFIMLKLETVDPNNRDQIILPFQNLVRNYPHLNLAYGRM